MKDIGSLFFKFIIILQKHSSQVGIVTSEQKTLLFELLKKNFNITKDLNNRSVLTSIGTKSTQKVWNKIALKCNAAGPPKTVFQWKKVFFQFTLIEQQAFLFIEIYLQCWYSRTLKTQKIIEKIQKNNLGEALLDLKLYPVEVQKMIEFCGLHYFLKDPAETPKLNQVYVIETSPQETLLLEDVKVKLEEPYNTCRACLKNCLPEDVELHLLDYTYVDDIQLRDIYKELVGCNTPENEYLLPASICVDCERLLLAFREFRGKCHSNEAHFLDMAKKNLAPEINKIEPETFDAEILADACYMLPDEFFLDFNEDYATEEVEVQTDNTPMVLTADIEQTNSIECPTEQPKTKIKGVKSPESTVQNIDENAKSFKCDDCGIVFQRSQDLVIHFRTFHKLAEDLILQGKLQRLKTKVRGVEEEDLLFIIIFNTNEGHARKSRIFAIK
jgi:hypothetical protein